MKTGKIWIWIVVALLAGNVLAVSILIGSAGSTRGRVLPDAYERAAEFDAFRADEAASASMGWRATVSIARGTVEVALTGADGAPVRGAVVRVSGYQRTRADRTVALALLETGPGRYSGAIGEARPGWYELTVVSQLRHDGHVTKVSVEAK